MPFCHNCGEPSKAEAEYCSNCGAKFKPETIGATHTEPTPVEVSAYKIPRRRSHRKAVAIALTVLIVFGLVGYNIYQMYSLNQLKVELSYLSVNIDYFLIMPKGLKISFVFKITNPSSIALYVPDIDYVAYLRDQRLTDGSVTGQIINSGSTIYVSVPLSLDWFELGDTVIAILNQYLRRPGPVPIWIGIVIGYWDSIY